MDDVNELLGEELLAQVQEKIGDKKLVFSDNFIPKTRFEEVNTQKNELKKINEDLVKSVESLEKNTGTVESLQEELKTIKQNNSDIISSYDQRVMELQKESAVKIDMIQYGVKNIKAVSALLDLDSVTVIDDKPVGLSEQLDTLKTTDEYLFKVVEQKDPPGAKINPKGSFTVTINPFDPKTFNMIEQMRLQKEQPEYAAKLRAEALKK